MRTFLLYVAIAGAVGGLYSWIGALLVLVALIASALQEYQRACIAEEAAEALRLSDLVRDRAARSITGDRTCDVCTKPDLTSYTVTLTHDRPTLVCADCAPLLTGVARG